MTPSQKVSFSVLGIFLVGMGMFLNYQLYVSLAGNNLLHEASYGMVGIALDISKILFLAFGAFLLTRLSVKTALFGILCITLWLALSCISLMAGWGFSLVVAQQYENEALLNSAQLKSAQASMESAQARLDNASQYAAIDASTLISRKEALENSLAILQKTLNGCPKDYNTKCINPTTAKIDRVQSELRPIVAQLESYQSYQAALSHKEAMAKQLANVDSSSISADTYVHPLFIAVAQMFGLTSIEAKNRLQFITFFLVEIIGGMCFLMVSLFGSTQEREFTFTETELKQVYGIVDNDISLITSEDKEPAKETSEDGMVACAHCGTTFKKKNHRHKYCSEACRLAGNGITDKAKMIANKHRVKA
jgi:hypothetical protein